MNKQVTIGLALLIGGGLAVQLFSKSEKVVLSESSLDKKVVNDKRSRRKLTPKKKSHRNPFQMIPPTVKTEEFPYESNSKKTNQGSSSTVSRSSVSKKKPSTKKKKYSDVKYTGKSKSNYLKKSDKKKSTRDVAGEKKKSSSTVISSSSNSSSNQTIVSGASSPITDSNSVNTSLNYWIDQFANHSSLKTLTQFVSFYKNQLISPSDFYEVLDILVIQSSQSRYYAMLAASKVLSSNSFVIFSKIKNIDKSLEESLKTHMEKYLSIEHVPLLYSILQNSYDFYIYQEAISTLVLSAELNSELKSADPIIYSDLYNKSISLIEKLQAQARSSNEKDFYNNSLEEFKKLLSK